MLWFEIGTSGEESTAILFWSISRPISNPLKLPVQVFPRKNEGRGPSMRAMMLILSQVPLGQKLIDLFTGEAVAEFYRRLTGDHV